MLKRIICHTEMSKSDHAVRYYVQPYENNDGSVNIYMHGFMPWVLNSIYEVKKKRGLFTRMAPISRRPTLRLLFDINGKKETMKIIAPEENDKVITDLIVTLKLKQNMIGVNLGKVILDEPLKKFMKDFNEDKAREKILGAKNPRCFYETGETLATDEIYIRHFLLSGVIGDGEKSILGVYIGDKPNFEIGDFLINIEVDRTAVDDYNCAVVINEDGCKLESLSKEEFDLLNNNIRGL